MPKQHQHNLLTSVSLAFALACGLAKGAETKPPDSQTIFDMDEVRHRPTTFGEKKAPAGTVEVVEGKFGRACSFRFAPNAISGFFVSSVKATPDWDRAAGISFWVKGDGSTSWGGLELIDGSDYALRYGYCFPIDSTEWKKIAVPWCDLIPELPTGKLVDPERGYAPSRFGNLWFGKWHYWRDYPACSYTIDEISLEPSIPVDRADYDPAHPGLTRLLAKLQAKKPVTIVTMGDSLSDKRHWANRQILWSEVLVAELKKRFGGNVQLVNPAIGGTQLTQNLVLVPRWLKDTPQPDLITVWFGFNDWSAGMRGGPWQEYLRFAVDRLRRATAGRSEILLITTCPALERWDTMEELAEGVRTVAAEKKSGLADVAASFHRTGADAAIRPSLYCADKTHLGEAGHRLAAQVVLNAILGTEEVIATETVSVSDDASLRTALREARPGRAVRIAPGRYQPGVYVSNLKGTKDAPIVIEGSNPDSPPLFEGGSEAWHLSDCAYVTLRNITVRGQKSNGINVDDGGSFDTPAHHIRLERLRVEDVGPTGNHDPIKLSGLDDFVVADCTIEGWGGQAVDMVGCHRGVIERCVFRGKPEFSLSAGPQTKGGSSQITIRRCLFVNAGRRAVNIGGSTAMSVFRPQGARYEAKDILVEGCTFVGGEAPIAFVGVDGATVRYNTFYRPGKWVMRILQETTEKHFTLCRNGLFERNLIAFRRADISTFVNVGPNTEPESFVFAENLWYCEDRPQSSRPILPTQEKGSVYGVDPKFGESEQGRFAPQNPSAARFGASAFQPGGEGAGRP